MEQDDRKDIERYRWLRSEEVATDPKYYAFWQEFGTKLCREGKLDALIDAEMSLLNTDQKHRCPSCGHSWFVPGSLPTREETE